MGKYFLTECNPIGDNHPRYGQTYWAESNQAQKPLMFNSTRPVRVGDTISFEEERPMVSQKGTEFLRLKKVRVVGQETPLKGSSDELLKLVKEIHAVVVGDANSNSGKVSNEALDEEDKVDLSEIPF